MKNTPFYTKVKTAVISSIKIIWIYGSLSIAVWVLLITLWTSGVYLYYWDIFDSLLVSTIFGLTYLSMSTLAAIGLSFSLVFNNKRLPVFIKGLIELIFAILPIILSNMIVSLIFYPNDNVSEVMWILSFHPLFIIPSIITFLLLVYSGRKINDQIISESVLLPKE